MHYHITIAQIASLSVGAEIGACFRLHGCREINTVYQLDTEDAFACFVRLGWIGGVSMLTNKRLPLVSAEAVAEAQKHTLDSDDPMYQVATNYHAFQMIRERIRRALSRNDILSAPFSDLRKMLTALSMWLMLYRTAAYDGTEDDRVANIIRQNTALAFNDHKRAIATIGSTANRAYVQDVSGSIIANLSSLLADAARSSKPNYIRVDRGNTFEGQNRVTGIRPSRH